MALAKGWRFEEKAVQVGQRLPPSFEWVGDQPTTRKLAGTCAFSSVGAALKYAAYSQGAIVRLEGRRARNSATNDRVQGEIILADAVVVAIEWVRKSSASGWVKAPAGTVSFGGASYATNPPRGGELLSRHALELAYVHKEDGQAYLHKFAAGVHIRVSADRHTVTLWRPDGKPLADDF